MLDKLGTNWKTNAGGIAMILVGLAGLIAGAANPESEHAMSLEAAIAMIAAGLSAIGIGHKAERIRKQLPPTSDYEMQPKTIRVTVNGKVHNLVTYNGKREIGYQELATLADRDGQDALTITYRDREGRRNGIIGLGQTIDASDGMIFNVAFTG